MSYIDPNENFTSANEIMPGFWLGNQASSQDINLLKKVDVIVNCTKHIPFKTIADKKHYHIRIPINDPGAPYENIDYSDINKCDPGDDQVIMIKYLPKLIGLIADFRRRGLKILVHCHAGAQRSAAVVAAYLMQHCKWAPPPNYTKKQLRSIKFDAVVKLLIRKRPVAFYGGNSINFKPALSRHLGLN